MTFKKEKVILKETVILTPNEINYDINKNIMNYLKINLEKKCNQYGYILKIENIIKKSQGLIMPHDFTGNIKFQVLVDCEAYRPREGDIIRDCKINMINKIGIFASKDFLNIIITSRNDILPDDYDKKYKIGQLINVFVLGSKFDLYDNKITILGKIQYYSVKSGSLTIALPNLTTDPMKDMLDDNLIESLQFLEDDMEKLNHNSLGYTTQLNKIKNLIDPYYKKGLWQNFKYISNPYELLSPNKIKKKGGSSIYYGKKIPAINAINRAFFKFIEMNNEFNILPDQKKIKVAFLAEGPGGFIQAVSYLRKQYNEDEYFAVTLKSDNKHLLFNEGLIKQCEKINPKLLQIKYYDICQTDNALKFIKKCKKINVVTADGGFEIEEYDQQEQQSLKLIFHQLWIALAIQEKGGHFICKIFSSTTYPTMFIIMMCSLFYDEVYITKPLTSRPMNSEKYIIAKQFKGISKQTLDWLESVSREWTKKNKIIKSFSSIPFPSNLLQIMRDYNKKINDDQIHSIYDTICLIDTMKYNSNETNKLCFSEYKQEQEKIAREWCLKNKINI